MSIFDDEQRERQRNFIIFGLYGTNAELDRMSPWLVLILIGILIVFVVKECA